MRKNGFTLVEMMTVIIIMVLLGLIAVFSITGIVKNSTDRLYQLQINNILDASRTYAVKNSNTLSDNNEITLCDLKRSSLLDEDLKDPKTEEQFDNSLIVKIVKNSDGEFEFTFDGVTKMENYYCDLDISVSINGDSPLYVKLGDTHNELGISVTRKDLICSKRVGSSTSNNTHCYYDLTISGDYTSALRDNKYNKVGTYKENYLVKDDNFTSTITRTIIVQDKTPPTIAVNYGGTTYTNSFSIRALEGSTISLGCVASDNFDSSVSCERKKDGYNNATAPGTYEIVYEAKDSAGNSSSLVVNITLLAKNKKMLVGVKVDKVDWTNESVNLKIIPLYSSQNCEHYYYTFGGYFWNDVDTQEITENGDIKVGIKCSNDNNEDYMIYKVTNIDKEEPVFENGGSILVTPENPIFNENDNSLIENFDEVVKNNIPHYYSSDSVKINQPSGAKDSISGVAGYEIYVNDEQFSDNVLSAEGKYKIEILAFDNAGNRSEKVTVAYVVISKAKPVCEFLKCNTPRECSNKNPISGTYITYNNQYYLTTNDFSTPVPINYKFSCTYEYYDGEEDIYKNLNISKDKFYMMEETGDTDRIDVVSVTNNTSESETNCNNGKCTKTNYYTASINSYGIYNTTYFYLRPNSFCDRIGNCNIWQATSMDLWVQ